MGVRSRFGFWVLAVCGVALACGRTDKKESPHSQTGSNAGAGGEMAKPSDEPACAVAIDGQGARHCAVYQDGSLWCWGDGAPRPEKIAGVARATRVVLGERHGCTLGDGLTCWGNNDSAQIDDSGVSPLPPTQLAFKSGGVPAAIKGFGVSGAQTCVVDYQSHVYCRGTDASGEPSGPQQVEVGGEVDTTMPGPGTDVFDDQGQIFDLSDWRKPALRAGFGNDNDSFGSASQDCVVKRGGTLWCGHETGGLLAKLVLNGHALRVDLSDERLCVVSDEGKVWCEDAESSGFLPLSDARAISVNDSSACAITGDGKVWCWGQGRDAPELVSDCSEQTTAPFTYARTAIGQRNSARGLSDAGRLRAQAVCSCAGLEVDQQCISDEDLAPNPECLNALATTDQLFNPSWDCQSFAMLQDAECFRASPDCGAGKSLPLCPGSMICPLLPEDQRRVDSYCRRRSCSVVPQPSVQKPQICDGVVDCEDGTDERNCSPTQKMFECGAGVPAVSLHNLCDGVTDCPDGSDETDCMTPKP